jgi:NAD-dependent DNA ligase
MDAIMMAVRQAFGMVTKLFSAGEKYASAIEHIGTFVDESAAAFSDEAKHKRAMNIELQRAEFEHQVQERKNALANKVSRTAPKAIAASK